MAKKRRAPIDQLREAGRISTEMLKEKGIITQKSAIDAILADPRSPILPGIPAYLPHAWTLKAAQRMMRDFIVIWKEETAHSPRVRDDITEFWKFILKELSAIERKHNAELMAMPAAVKKMENTVGKLPFLKEIFAPMQQKENDRAMYRFVVDSFAVARASSNHHSVGEFLNWYIEWTQDLYELWIKPEKREEVTRV